MPQLIRQISTAVIWIASTDFQGMASEVKLPDLEAVVDDDGRVGLVGVVPTFTGIQKPEASFTFTAWSEEWAKPFANMITPLSCVFRGALANIDNSDDILPYVVTLGGTSQKAPMGGASPQEVSKWEVGLNVRYMRQEVGGKEIVLFNAATNEYKVGGKDILRSTRQAMGLA